ncbi:MAG TPA: hypothetical protein DD670_02275 [Planctomycetaceae bacterium]|nr:hypothetical protein [Planctomycetaceae bacterium]
MRVFFVACLLVSLCVGVIGEAADLIGVYVMRDDLDSRIEFLPDGKSFQHDHHGEKGTYSRDEDTYVCRYEDGRQMRFRWEGKSLVDQDGDEWAPREELLAMPWKDVSPVTIVVLDPKTRKPIPRFTYSYTISTPDAKFDPMLVRSIEVESRDRSFVLSAPASCEIQMQVEGGAILGGYGTWRSYHLTTDNKDRRIEVLVGVGAIVSGVVVDASTGKPIEGARVSPVIFTPPLFSPDRRRAVKTDEEGRFTVAGVDERLGINVWHLDYLELNRDGFEEVGEKKEGSDGTLRIEMEAGERLVGVVKDPSGKPLSDVKVSDGWGKSVRTDAEGRFVLRSPRKWGGRNTYDLSFEKSGYLDQKVRRISAVPEGVAVVLMPQPRLDVRVVGPDGRPVTAYDLSANVGLEPEVWRCTLESVVNSEGRCSVTVRTGYDYGRSGKVWIGVKAPGFALWETMVDTWKDAKSIVAELKPGLSVHGSLSVSEDVTNGISIELLPRRRHRDQFTSEASLRQKMGRMKTTIDRSGDFRFENVGPGTYTLAISGPAISLMSTGVVVRDSDLDVGQFAPKGRGSISGIAYEPRQICTGDQCRLDENRGVWAFQDGQITFSDKMGRSGERDFGHLKPILFKTDEKGRFHVDGVPVGIVSVGFQYAITADIIVTHSRLARVVEGKTTEMRFFDTSGDWDVVCEFVIGDGSREQVASGTGMGANRKVGNVTTRPPMIKVQLAPLGNGPTSFHDGDWEELDAQNQMLLRDVQPGRYRMTVGDWLMSRGFEGTLHEMDVEIKPGGTRIVIPLGAGSITGAVRWSTGHRHMIHVVAVGKNTRAVRHARCDVWGNFCVRYLDDDEYMLFAHDYDAGWCRLPDTKVNQNTTDVGIHVMAPGGAIVGKTPPRLVGNGTVAVEATHENGITVEGPDWHDPIGHEFTIGGLWPGKWTIRMRQADKLIGETAVSIEGTESVACTLTERSP